MSLLLWSFFELSLQAMGRMKRTRLPSKRAVGTTPRSLPKLRLSTLALAAAVTFGFASPDALALALGRVTVQSALGEPLRAEIDVPQITPDEVSSLRANIAEPPVFREKGLEFSQVLSGVTITLQRRQNGSYFLQLSSDRPVTDPFIDVILDAKWQSGGVQRDFTMLFDPPTARQATPAAPIAAQTTPVAPPAPVQRSTPAPTAAAPEPAPAPASRAATAAAPSTGRAATARALAAASAPSAPRAPVPALPGETGGKRVTVQSGDTAGKLAAASKPASVSLDQMLVAMLRANPDAFVDGNINRLKSGVVLDIPTGDQASSVAPQEAHQTVVAQSRDFNEFRRRLAEGLAPAAVPGSGRQASGTVKAQVEDKKAATSSPDKLTLSKGAVQGKPSSADQIAKERANKDAAARVAELNKNIADLNKLTGTPAGAGTGTGSGTGTTRPAAGVTAPPGVSAPAATAAPATAARAASAAAPAAATPPAPAPAAVTAAPKAPASAAPAPVVAATPAPAPAPVVAPAPTPAPVAATPAPSPSTTPAASPAPAAPAAVTSTPAASASQPGASAAVAAATPPVRKPAPAPMPPEPSVLDDVLDNPLIPALAIGLLIVLAGFGLYKFREKRKTASVDSSFLESRLQPDSFFGASGGQRIDTAETNNPTGSSMVYSPSQLDAAGDVDPVAEADVYLAYGRDLQAEEILKEALRINPQRVAIHGKLLEIYAKRRDAKAFEVVAAEAYNLTHGNGPEWDHICELGRELDASNPMYRPGGQPGAGAAAAAAVATPTSFNATRPIQAQPAPAAADVDLDLDFSLGDEPDTLQPPAVPAVVPAGRPPAASAPVAMDFSAAPSLDLPTMHEKTQPVQPVRLETPDLTINENSLNFELPAATPAPQAAPAPAPAVAKSDMLEFDLGGLSLDLPSSAPAPAPTPAPALVPAAASKSMNLDVLPTTGGADTGLADGGDSPLATKLSLAEEFNAIGDTDGARSLAEEVLAEASGDLKSRAQRLLAEIG